MGERAMKEPCKKQKGVFEMKKLFKRTLALILALATVFSIGFAANASEIDCGWWTLDEESGLLTVYENIPSSNSPGKTEWIYYREKIKAVKIVNGVTSIGRFAFRGCSYIEKVELPVTLEHIGEQAFFSCGKLTSIELPGSLRSLGRSAFGSCTSLTSIVIPARVYSVPDNAFMSCKGLESVEIISSGTIIQKYAFMGCENIGTLKIADGIIIDSTAFDNCLNITTVNYTGTNESYKAMPVVSEGNNSLYGATVNCNHPATPYPVSVSVGTMPEKTEYEVGEELDLTGFELALEMNDGSTQILSDLSKTYIHRFNSSSVGEYTFTVEYYGYKVYVPYTVVTDPNGKCGNNLKWVFDGESGTLTISGYGEMFTYSSRKPAPWNNYRTFIKSVNIGENVESIGTNAFYGCDGITELQLPVSIKNIDPNAFSDSGIEKIHYSGTAEDWSKISGDKSQFRELNLYFSGELHGHSYANDEIKREPTCRIPGTLRHSCECGDFNTESISTLPHTPGEWETLDSGKKIKKCTVCSMRLEVKAEEPDEELTQPEENPTEPEEENSGDEAEEENGVFEVIIDTIGKIVDAIASIFGKIKGLFAI